MSAARALVYLLGAILVIGGLVLLFFETGLAAWVPPGIALAGLIILVGMFVIGMSDRDEPVHTEHVEHVHHERDDRLDNRRRY